MDKEKKIASRWSSNVSAASQFEAVIKDNRLCADRVKKSGLKSENPLMRLMHSNPANADYSSISNITPDISTMSLSTKRMVYPNLVNDEGGKALLSKGIIPSAPPMRYDVANLTSNWYAIEQKHEALRRELDSVDLELQRRETELKSRILASTANSSKGFSRFANNSVVKPGSNICGSGFTWSGGFSNTYKEDFVRHEKLPDPLASHYKKLHSEYGECMRTCDLPEPNIYINPNAPKKFKGTLTRL